VKQHHFTSKWLEIGSLNKHLSRRVSFLRGPAEVGGPARGPRRSHWAGRPALARSGCTNNRQPLPGLGRPINRNRSQDVALEWIKGNASYCCKLAIKRIVLLLVASLHQNKSGPVAMKIVLPSQEDWYERANLRCKVERSHFSLPMFYLSLKWRAEKARRKLTDINPLPPSDAVRKQKHLF